MIDAAGPPSAAAAPGEKVVILLLPEVLGADVAEAQLHATLIGAAKPVRALLCLPDDKGGALAALLARLGVETEILLGPAIAAPSGAAGFILHAPPGTLPAQQTEFALALSDAVLVAPGFEQNLWIRTAKGTRQADSHPRRPTAGDPDLHQRSRGPRSHLARSVACVADVLLGPA